MTVEKMSPPQVKLTAKQWNICFKNHLCGRTAELTAGLAHMSVEDVRIMFAEFEGKGKP